MFCFFLSWAFSSNATSLNSTSPYPKLAKLVEKILQTPAHISLQCEHRLMNHKVRQTHVSTKYLSAYVLTFKYWINLCCTVHIKPAKYSVKSTS